MDPSIFDHNQISFGFAGRHHVTCTHRPTGLKGVGSNEQKAMEACANAVVKWVERAATVAIEKAKLQGVKQPRKWIVLPIGKVSKK